MSADRKAQTVPAATVALMSAAFASQSSIVVLAPAMVRVATDLHTGVGVISQARSVTAVAAIGLSLVLARVVARLGVGRTITAGALAAIVACSCIVLSPNAWIFLAAHLLVGVAVAALLSASFAGAAACGDRTPGVLGLVAGANSLAWIVVNPLSGLLTQHVSWQAAFGVPALAAALAAAVSRHAPEPSDQVSPEAERGGLFGIPSARNWLLAELASYTAWTAILTFIGPLLIQKLGQTETATGIALAIGVGAFFVISTRSATVTAGANLRGKAIAASIAIAVAGTALFTATSALWAAIAVFFLAAAGAGIRTPAMTLLGIRANPGHRTSLMTARTGITQLGYLTGAALGGVLLTWWGFAAIAALVATTMTIAVVLIATKLRP